MPVTINRTVLETEALVNERLVPLMNVEGRRVFAQRWEEAIVAGRTTEQLISLAVTCAFMHMGDNRLPDVSMSPSAGVRSWLSQRMTAGGCTNCAGPISDTCPRCLVSSAQQYQARIDNVTSRLNGIDLEAIEDETERRALQSLTQQIQGTLAGQVSQADRFIWSTGDTDPFIDGHFHCRYCLNYRTRHAGNLEEHQMGCQSNPAVHTCGSCEWQHTDLVVQCPDCDDWVCDQCSCCGYGDDDDPF